MPHALSGYFSIRGRLSLGGFRRIWLRLTYLSVAALVLAIIAAMQGLPMVAAAIAILAALTVVSNYATFVRRLHDRGLPGWLALVSFAIAACGPALEHLRSPALQWTAIGLFLVQIWLLIETFFRRGQKRANRYGPDPYAEDEPIAEAA